MHPNYSMTMDWGFVDGSVRFWNPDTKKVGLRCTDVNASPRADQPEPAGIFEQLHQDDVTAAMFAGTVLVTASRDCTVGLWHVSPKSEPVGLHLASFLFGHRSPIVALAVSIVLSVVASADSTGRVLLWDLSTYQMIQEMDVHDEVKVFILSGLAISTLLLTDAEDDQDQ